MTDFDTLAAGLRTWAEGDQINSAAVEPLCWHETWIRRRDFLAAAADIYEADEDGPAMTRIRWDDARVFAGGSPRCSTSELGILRLAIAIGAGDFALSGFGRVHRRKAAEAFAAACGWRLEGDIPEAGHSHPDFIPGTPETCTRCAIDAGDEGKRLWAPAIRTFRSGRWSHPRPAGTSPQRSAGKPSPKSSSTSRWALTTTG